MNAFCGSQICSDCKRMNCPQGCNCDCHWMGGKLVLAYRTVTQDTCPHDAKVKMAGFKDRYECTRCQKIISYVPLNKKSNDDENENYRIIL